MSTHTQKIARQHNSLRRKKQSAGEQEAALPDTINGSNIMHLQRLIGNQGVQRLIAQQQTPSPLIAPVSAHPVQHRITRTAAPVSIQRDFFDDASDWVEDKASGAEEWVEEKANDVSEGVNDAGEWVEEKAEDAGEWVEEKANDVSEGVDDAKEWAEEKADDAGEWVEEKADDAGEWVEEKANDVSEGVNDAKEWVEEKANDVSEGAEGAKEWVQEKANDLGLDPDAIAGMVRAEIVTQVNQQVPQQLGYIGELNNLENYREDNGVNNASIPSYKGLAPQVLDTKIKEQEGAIDNLESTRTGIVKKARADARLTLENAKEDILEKMLTAGVISGVVTGVVTGSGAAGLIAALVAALVGEYVSYAKARNGVKAILIKAKEDLKVINTTIKLEKMKLEAMKAAGKGINVEDLPDANPPIEIDDLPDANPPIEIDDLPDAK